jgi:hypothetical protein
MFYRHFSERHSRFGRFAANDGVRRFGAAAGAQCFPWPSPLELSIRSDVVGALPSGILDSKVSSARICADRA